MIDKGIVDLIADRTKIRQRNFIEKDLLLHRILVELSTDNNFLNNYAFKGGTCLMKCYIKYYRFSEDLDFTYMHQKEFENKSEKQKRKMMSEKINLLMKSIETLSTAIGLEFKPIKSDTRYVQMGASNKQVSFRVWYTPNDSAEESFIKIQVNFLEIMEYPFVKKEADNFFFGRYKNFQSAFLLPENSEWMLKIPVLYCYDIKEILVEKVRAVLTRKETKARDYIDIYMIQKKEKIDVRDYKKQIIRKVKSFLKFEKYATGLSKRHTTAFTFDRKEEERILLISLPKDFDVFFSTLKSFLEELVIEIYKK